MLLTIILIILLKFGMTMMTVRNVASAGKDVTDVLTITFSYVYPRVSKSKSNGKIMKVWSFLN